MKGVKNVTAFLESIGGGTLEGLYQPNQVCWTSRIGNTSDGYLLSLTRNDNPLPRALKGLRQVGVNIADLLLRPADEIRVGRQRELEVRVCCRDRVQALIEEVEVEEGRVVWKTEPHIQGQHNEPGLVQRVDRRRTTAGRLSIEL